MQHTPLGGVHQVLSVPGSGKGEVTALRPTADQRSKYTPTLQVSAESINTYMTPCGRAVIFKMQAFYPSFQLPFAWNRFLS